MRVTSPSANCFMKVEFQYDIILFTEYEEVCER